MSNLIDTIKNFDYAAWVFMIKVIFLSFSVFFILVFFFCLYKVKKLTRHGHGHVSDHAPPATVSTDHTSAPQSHGIQGHDASSSVKRVAEGPAYTETWEQIYRLANSVREAEWKLSVIEADKLVDDILQQLGYPGETMGERLMLIKPDQLSSLQDLWDAHKLRNLLVHEVSYKVKHEQVLAAINAFERVLRELGAVA